MLTRGQQRDALATVKDNPYTYFHSLSRPEQNRHFGAEQATAIRSGAQISETVNADRHMWRSRYTPKRGPGELPHSIGETVMREAKGDRAAAVAQFKRYGLLDESGHRRVSATERGKRFAEASPTETRTGAHAARNTQTASDGNNARMGSGSGGKRPGSSGFGGGDDPHALADKLDADFAPVNASLTRSERDAIARWQQPGRGYEAVQELLRTGTGSRDAQAWARKLDAAIDRGRLVRSVSVWRGVRSTQAAFHVRSERFGEIVGRSGRFGGSTATTLLRDVAAREFTKPELAGGPALLRMRLPEGLPAAWLRNVGLPEVAYQMELLLPARLGYRVHGVTFEAGIATVELEVQM